MERAMLEFYVNYTIDSGALPKRVQAGPYQSVAIAVRHRSSIENTSGISHCWVGISRDDTKQLVDTETKVMPFVAPTIIHSAA
jgi:hypothetical protein